MENKRKRSESENDLEYWKKRYLDLKQLIEEKNRLISEKDSIIANQKNIIIEKEELFTFTLDTKNKADPQILLDYDKMQDGEINVPNIKEDEQNALIKYKNKFTEIIEKINKELGYKKTIQEIINHKLGENLKIETFIESFEKAVANLNISSMENNKKSIKLFLKFFNENNNLIFNKDCPLHIRQFQMDLIMDLLLNYKDNLLQKECLLYSGYTKVPFTKGFNFISEKQSYQFDKEYIKTLISNNIGILNGYKKMLQIFVTRDNYSYEDLIKEINKIIDESNIYFIDFPKDLSGLTICNGDIFIKSEYLIEAMNIEENDDYRLTAVAKIYLTIIHEICHKLQHILRYKLSKDDDDKKNYFNKSFKTTNLGENDQFDIFDSINKGTLKEYPKNLKKKYSYSLNFDKNLIYNESGDFFDSDIYLGYSKFQVSVEMAIFFLTYGCYDYNKYQGIIENLLSDTIISYKCTNSSFKRNQKNAKMGCFFSLTRNI